MGRRFKLSNNYYEEDGEIFDKTIVTMQPGVTVLVGCNGAGKTTMLNQIRQTLENKDIPYLFHSNLTDGEKEYRGKALFHGNINFVARSMMSSEGENIVNVMKEVARKMGTLSRNNPTAKELWFLFDAIDSGLSVDNIVDLKEQLFSSVLENEKGKDVYFVISANEYELARDENCLDVIGGKYIRFNDYEEYRTFILQSKEAKRKRCDQ